MDKTPSITNADDAKLCELISRSRERVLLVGPGISEDVAMVLQEAWTRLGPETVDVILDVDPEVCRLGYGTLEGLKIVRAAAARAGSCVNHQPGIRIGVLICDHTTLIFSPTPLLIEAGSSQPDHPNAIQLGSPPEQVARELGLGPNRNMERLIGLDPVQQQQVEAVETDLAECPPAKFDLARRVRVYTNRFQFVELKMTGCYVSRRKVPIPSELLGFAKDQELGRRLHAAFDLINDIDLVVEVKEGENTRKISESTLRDLRKEIESDFLIPLPGYGVVVLRANEENLGKAVDDLRKDVKTFHNGIDEKLQEHVDENVTALVDALLPAVKQNPPAKYKKVLGPNPSDANLRLALEESLKEAFSKASAPVQEMKVSLVFKDMTYESCNDEKLLAHLSEHVPGLEALKDEREAAEAEDTQ